MKINLELINEEAVVKTVSKQVPVSPATRLQNTQRLLESGDIYYTDPRPDLEEDSMLWLQIFVQAGKLDKRLVENLWKVRNWGTRIQKGQNSFFLYPDIGSPNLWPDHETYEKWRNQLLGPYRKQIIEILKRLFLWEE